jgi:hypothetical protein
MKMFSLIIALWTYKRWREVDGLSSQHPPSKDIFALAVKER